MTDRPSFWFLAATISAAVTLGSYFAGWDLCALVWFSNTVVASANFGLMTGLRALN